MVGRSRGQMTLCVVCTAHKGHKESKFLSLASKPRLTVSLDLVSKPVAMVLVVWPQNHSLGSVWASKPTAAVWWFNLENHRDGFFSLGIKTKWAMVYRLHHKIDGRMKMVRDTRRDLAASFVWKWVRLGFPSLASRLAEAQREWCMWHHRGGRVEIKSKTDGSMRWAASDSSIPTLPFCCIRP
jgi:hypothetical protein